LVEHSLGKGEVTSSILVIGSRVREASAVGSAVAIAAAGCFVYFVLLIVALGQLTGERRSTAIKYVALAVVAAWILIDWLSGATDWTMIEGFVLIVTIPFGIAHLANLLAQESRQR
jgi:threonine/homoserine efflux transporter RhtA